MSKSPTRTARLDKLVEQFRTWHRANYPDSTRSEEDEAVQDYIESCKDPDGARGLSGDEMAEGLLEKLVEMLMASFRSNNPDSARAVSDEMLRAKAIEALRKLETDEYHNHQPGAALRLALRGRGDDAGAQLKRHLADQNIRWKHAGARERGKGQLDSVNQRKEQKAEQNRSRWLSIGAPLRQRFPYLKDKGLAEKIHAQLLEDAKRKALQAHSADRVERSRMIAAEMNGHGAETIRKAIPELGLSRPSRSQTKASRSR